MKSRFRQKLSRFKGKHSQGSGKTHSRFKQGKTQSRVKRILDSTTHCAEEACEVIAGDPSR